METKLTKSDLSMILESLKYTRKSFENYQDYPSYEFKLQRLEDVNSVITKIQELLKEK